MPRMLLDFRGRPGRTLEQKKTGYIGSAPPVSYIPPRFVRMPVSRGSSVESSNDRAGIHVLIEENMLLQIGYGYSSFFLGRCTRVAQIIATSNHEKFLSVKMSLFDLV